MSELYTRELIDDWLEYKHDKCIRSDEMDSMIDCTIRLLRSYMESHKAIAERDAEIEAHEKREAALEMEVARLEQSVSDMSSDYHRAFNENMAYLAFFKVFDTSFDFWVDGTGCSILGGSDIEAIEQAREQLRSVIDGG